jgi:GMP synthase (glutamine-hydrolysing)
MAQAYREAIYATIRGPMQHQKVLVIDFGGQYTQLIVRRVREAGIFSEMVAWDKSESALLARPDAVILSGGPRSTLEENAPWIDPALLEGIPVLGICYGHQFLARALGGQVEGAHEREYGRRHLSQATTGTLVGDLSSDQVWMSHGDQVLSAPPGFQVTASTESCPIAAFEDVGRRIYGVQFHPEVSHTLDGSRETGPASPLLMNRFS